MFCRLKSSISVAAIVSMAAVFYLSSLARAKDAGDWELLSTATFELKGENALEALVSTLNDLPGLLKKFKPAGAKISDLRIIAKGPKNLPRISFKAETDVSIGPFTTAQVAKVVGDIRMHQIVCRRNNNSPGYKLEMDLRASDEPITANASTYVLQICYIPNANGSLFVLGESFMQIGPDYGSIAAGELVTNLLKKQTKPLVTALQSAVAEKLRKIALDSPNANSSIVGNGASTR